MPVETSALALAFGKSLLFVLAAILPIPEPGGHRVDLPRPDRGRQRRHTDAAGAPHRAQHVRADGGGNAGRLLRARPVRHRAADRARRRRADGGGHRLAAAAGRSPPTNDRRTALAEAFTPEQASRQAFYPLTFPISCGPGSIAAAIAIGVSLHDRLVARSLARFAGGTPALTVIAIVMFVAFRDAQHLLRPLGETGTIVFVRLSAFILLCLGVQIVWDGASELLRTL